MIEIEVNDFDFLFLLIRVYFRQFTYKFKYILARHVTVKFYNNLKNCPCNTISVPFILIYLILLSNSKNQI